MDGNNRPRDWVGAGMLWKNVGVNMETCRHVGGQEFADVVFSQRGRAQSQERAQAVLGMVGWSKTVKYSSFRTVWSVSWTRNISKVNCGCENV
jgi:hypothetical protein